MPYVPRGAGGDEDEDKSILGFLSNLVGDVPEIARGIGTAGGSVLADIHHVGTDVLPGALPGVSIQEKGEEYDYKTDELLKALAFDPGMVKEHGVLGSISPAIREDLARRYGFRGGDIAKEELYENPLSYLADIAAVATGGGAIAGKAGKAAAAAGKPGLARSLGYADEAARTFRFTDEAARIREMELSANPVRRLAQSAAMKTITRPLKSLEEDPITSKLIQGLRDADPSIIDDLRAGRIATARKKIAGVEHLDRMLGLAESDVTRALRDVPGKALIRKEMTRILGHAQRRFLDRAVGFEGRAERVLRTLNKDELTNFAHLLQGVRGQRAASLGTMSYDDIAGTLLRSASSPDQAIGTRLVEHFGRVGADTDGTRVLIPSHSDTGRIGREVAEVTGSQLIEATPQLVRVALPDGRTHTVRLQTEATKRVVDLLEDDAARVVELGNQGLADEVEAAQALVEDLSESIVDELQGNLLDRPSRAVADYRILSHEAITQPLLRRGELKYATHMDHSYLGRRLEDMAASSSREARMKRMEDTRGEWRNYRAADIERGVQRPVHFSHMDERRGSYGDFLMTKGQRALSRSKPKALKESTGLQFLQETYRQDVRDVFARQARQIARYEQVQELTDEVVRRYGRRIEHADDVAPSEAVYNPHAAKVHYETRKDIEAAFTRHFDKHPDEDFEVLLGRAIKDVLPETENRIIETLRVAKEKGLPVYAVPKQVAKQLESTASTTMNWGVRLFWDGLTNSWRSIVLPGRPAWITNNILGNTTFTMLQAGVRPLADVLRMGFSKRFRREVQAIVPEEVYGGLFGVSEQYVPHLGRAAETMPGKVVMAAKKSPVGRGLHTYFGFMRRVNSQVEDTFRSASYLSAMERQVVKGNLTRVGRQFYTSKRRLDLIADGGADEAKVASAVSEVNKFLNDYNALSPFERKVTRRFLMPFWSFYKHTVKLMARLPIENPGRFAVLDKVTRVSQELLDEELGERPEWLQTAIPLGPGDEPGTTEFLPTSGMNPFSGLTRGPLHAVLSGAHPAIQSMFEENYGVDSFTGNPITSPNIVPGGFGSDQMYRIEDGQAVPIEHTGRGVLEQLIRSVPQAEVGRDVWEELFGEGAGARYGTGQVIRDPTTGEPTYPSDVGADIGALFGLGTFDYNLEEWQRRTEEERRAALEEYARRTGLR